MSDLRVTPLGAGLWALDDDRENSVYLVEGSRRALCIDTGNRPEPLLPALRALTDLPIDLALTHAHIDHMYHMDAFDRVYLHAADIAAWKRTLGPLYVAGHALYHLKWHPAHPSRATALHDGDRIDLGGIHLAVMHAPGHTPGSVLFRDDAHRALFTGDAFGSGEAVWMWLPGCARVSAYLENLRALIPKLQPFRKYAFYGGHRLQGLRESGHPNGHPLTMQVVLDMAKLCEGMLKGEITGKPIRIVPGLPMRAYWYGNACMVARRSGVR